MNQKMTTQTKNYNTQQMISGDVEHRIDSILTDTKHNSNHGKFENTFDEPFAYEANIVD